jgi:hypothetical protein
VAAPEVLHERVTTHDHAGAAIAFEASHRAKTRLELPVVGFGSIVRVLVGVVERGRDQLIDGGEHCLLLWRGFEPDRFDDAHVMLEHDWFRARGVSLTPSYSLHYERVPASRWVTRELTLHVHADTGPHVLMLGLTADGEWTANRTGIVPGYEPGPLPDLSDADDCDLALCPLTNTMPILRNDLVGRARRRQPATSEYVMAWVSVPDLTVHRSEQRYAVSDPGRGRNRRPGALRYRHIRHDARSRRRGPHGQLPWLGATDRDHPLTFKW